MPDQNSAAIPLPSPPAPPTPPNVGALSSQELAKVLTQWKEMARQLEKQADKFEDEADARPADVAAQFKAASRQWHEQSQTIRAQADQWSAKARESSTTGTSIFDQGGVSVVEQDGRTIIKKDGKTLVDVPSKDRGRSSRSESSGHTEVPIVFIVFLFLFLIVKTIMGPVNRRRALQAAGAGPGLSPADSATLQKIHRTVGQMERRVEALETILADPRRTAAFTAVTRPSTTTSNPSTSYESKV